MGLLAELPLKVKVVETPSFPSLEALSQSPQPPGDILGENDGRRRWPSSGPSAQG